MAAPAARVHCTDFGLARSIATGTRLTRTGEALGTPAYMSPEQARGETTLAPATDTWALGCLCYELLTGVAPFAADTVPATIARVLRDEPPPVHRRRPDLPRDLAAVVQAALAKSATARYADARALASDLERVLAGQRPEVRRARRRRLGRQGVLAAAAIAVVGGLALWAARPAPTGAPGNPESEGEALSRAASARAGESPAAAAEGAERAIALAPDRHDWRVQGGLWHWAAGHDERAVAAFAAVPDGTPTVTRARWLEGLVRFVQGLADRRTDQLGAGRDAWRAAAAGEGADAACARAALALADRDPSAPARLAELPTDDRWDVALLRGVAAALAVQRLGPDARAAALRDVSRILDAGLTPPAVLVQRGMLLAELGRVDEAMAEFDRALAIAPDYAVALLNRGEMHRRRRDFARARADFESILAVRPDMAPAHLNLGVLCAQLDDLAAAEPALDAALALEPGRAGTWFQRAYVRQRRQNVAGALSDLDEALRRDPDSVPSLLLRAGIRSDAGDFAAARADVDRAVALDPEDLTARGLRARIAAGAGDLAAARRDQDLLVAREPEDVARRVERARLALRMGDTTTVQADVARILELDPDQPWALARRADVRKRRGDLRGALADLDRALARSPGAADAWYARGTLRMQQRDLAAARADLDQALAVRPRFPEAHLHRGIVRFQVGDEDGALADYDAALAERPDYVEALGTRGSLRRARGDTAGAIDDLERCLQLAAPDLPMRATIERQLAGLRAAAPR